MAAERSDETSREIRRVALEMFATRGYDATSIRDIAAAVGIKGASMYHHFASKEEILWDLTETALTELGESWRLAFEGIEGDDPLTLLRAFVRSDVRFHATHRTAATLVNAQLHRLSPEHYSQAVTVRDDYENALVFIVEKCIATDRHDVPDIKVTVFAILQMAIAVSGWYRPEGDLSVPELTDIYEELAVKMVAPSLSAPHTLNSVEQQ